jgi:SAM-dependent methyltransferase
VDPFSAEAVRAAYDAVADDYSVAFGDDLERLPVDRDMLDMALAAATGGREASADGWMLELGCGPGPASAYLSGRTSRMVGIDLSAEMLTVASRCTPGFRGVQADLRRLPFLAGTCTLVIAYYSIQHLPRAEVISAFDEIHRILNRRGVLVIATHLGEGDVLIDDFLGHRIGTIGGALYRRETVIEMLAASGYGIVGERRREPLPHEFDSQRLYLLARRK